MWMLLPLATTTPVPASPSGLATGPIVVGNPAGRVFTKDDEESQYLLSGKCNHFGDSVAQDIWRIEVYQSKDLDMRTWCQLWTGPDCHGMSYNPKMYDSDGDKWKFNGPLNARSALCGRKAGLLHDTPKLEDRMEVFRM